MNRSYLDYCKLLNRCSAHSYAATTPSQHNYWLKQRARLAAALRARGWEF